MKTTPLPPLPALLWCAAFALALVSGHARATLGQAPAIFSAVQGPAGKAALATTHALVPSGQYAWHQTELETGTIVREFASPSGVVFAVAWRGPVLPDLGALLGNYFQTFTLATQEARQAGRRGSPVNIDRDGLLVHSSASMQKFFGYAYAPALVPTGVVIKDVVQ